MWGECPCRRAVSLESGPIDIVQFEACGHWVHACGVCLHLLCFDMCLKLNTAMPTLPTHIHLPPPTPTPQGYGLGTNTMTEGQKSGLIYGSLAFFFLLFILGYALP